MNVNKISKLILKAGKLKQAGRYKEYVNELRKLASELDKQRKELDQGILIVNKKIREAEQYL